ncbi:efflux RND transporter periplasmic adaptor subunit [Flavobacterium sp. 7A]|uniref:efflux RND transporter periplasmic adaptor subunit n=1 Tax=Flavobacterium sp. 7A TaxID=2940571 RepID=UPI00222607BF|nr:efflux RND transporter periplasmic adaptor subunit [Flavobacterium sp. 7A]MCW2118576.1 HlyD family secretion protein [Flavobacterium sp. 7A]
MNKKKLIISSLLVLVAAVIAFIFIKNDKAVLIEAKTTAATTGTVTTMITATGTIEPITQVEVGTQVSGVVEKIYVDYNSPVKEGQLIAELDKTNLKAALTQAQAAYDNALGQRTYLQSVFSRQKTLYDNKVISRVDYDEAFYNLQTAKSTVTEKLSALQQSKTNLSYANIYSPIDGVILSKAIDEGQTVAASFSTPTLFTIAQDLKEMQVEADVDEADIGDVKVGQRVTFTVDAYQGQIFNGKVTQVRLDPTVTSNVVTYTVVIKAENPDLKLKPGLTATISIYTLELSNILTTEAKAINYSPADETLMAYYRQQNIAPKPQNKNTTAKGTDQVWVYGANGEITQKQVTLGANDGVHVQIISGVQLGDKLLYSLKKSVVADGQKDAAGESPFMQKRSR